VRAASVANAEEGSYLRPINFLYDSTLGSRVTKKKREHMVVLRFEGGGGGAALCCHLLTILKLTSQV
jgi:hypothetical protein